MFTRVSTFGKVIYFLKKSGFPQNARECAIGAPQQACATGGRSALTCRSRSARGTPGASQGRRGMRADPARHTAGVIQRTAKTPERPLRRSQSRNGCALSRYLPAIQTVASPEGRCRKALGNGARKTQP